MRLILDFVGKVANSFATSLVCCMLYALVVLCCMTLAEYGLDNHTLKVVIATSYHVVDANQPKRKKVLVGVVPKKSSLNSPQTARTHVIHFLNSEKQRDIKFKGRHDMT